MYAVTQTQAAADREQFGPVALRVRCGSRGRAVRRALSEFESFSTHDGVVFEESDLVVEVDRRPDAPWDVRA